MCKRKGDNVGIESAFRIIPVHPDDRPLLGMEWKGKLFINTALPFGLRLTLKIFNSVADAIQWILEQEGIELLHYLDDFLIMGDPNSQVCKQTLRRALEICARLGVPIEDHKTEGPWVVITFLGIELITRTMTVRLPDKKLFHLREEIRRWQDRYSCTKREL